jgi:CelD/BcsL family acetyltransferase involved in cellulose biosynthesis
MHTRAISILGMSRSDEQAWRDLAARSIEPNPFYEVDFLAPACRYLRGGRSVKLFVAEEAGRFHACLPVAGTNVPGIRSSWRHMYGYLGTPLVAAERPLDALRCLMRALVDRGRSRRVVVLDLFGDDGPTATYLRRAADELGVTVHVFGAGDRAFFRCQDERTESLPSNVRRERRAKARKWRRLSADHGPPAVVDRAGQTEAAAQFLSIEASGWKGQSGTALGCRAGDAAFYREVTERFAASKRLRLYALEAGGRTLAMQTDFCASEGLFDWKVAYDERFATYSPGTQLQLQVLDLARAEGVQWIDSCADVRDEHQSRLAADRRRIATLALASRGRMEVPVLTSAVLLVRASDKMRVLSMRKLQSRMTEVLVTMRTALHR